MIPANSKRGRNGRRHRLRFTIAGKILFANCALAAAGAFSGTTLAQHYADEPSFVLGALLLSGVIVASLPVNYLVVRLALAPLRRLDDAMTQTESGSLDFDPGLMDSADRQISRLARSYAKMIERIRQEQQSVEKLSLIDPLTEIGNTRALSHGLETEIARIRRYGQTMPAAFSVLIIDLDNFKDINDTFGHLTGDSVLRDLARLLRSSVRKTDATLAALTHYRFGGDEFVIIAPHTGSEGASVLATRLDDAIRAFPFRTHSGDPIGDSTLGPVCASIGFASYPEEAASADALLDLADKRMYAIKESRAGGRVRNLPRAMPGRSETEAMQGGGSALGAEPIGMSGGPAQSPGETAEDGEAASL